MLEEERLKPLVVLRRQVEHREERAIVAARLVKAAVHQHPQIGARDVVRLEHLGDRPEIVAVLQPLPENLGHRRRSAAVSSICPWSESGIVEARRELASALFATPLGRSSRVIGRRTSRTTSRSVMFFSSRTLPGHG